MTTDLTHSERFGELRSLVAQHPDEHVWDDVCRLVEQWEPREVAEVVAPYLSTHLESWPTRLRRTPGRWLERVFAGEAVPELKLCRALVLSGRRALSSEAVQRLIATHICRDVRHVELFGHVLAPGMLQVLCEYSGNESLVSFASVRSEIMKRELSWFAKHPSMSTLERLTLHREYLDQQPISALCEPGALESLVALDIADNRLRAESLEMLWDAPMSASLVELDVSANLAVMGEDAWFMGEGVWPALERLDVSSLELGRGVRHLAQCDAPKLRALSVASNRLSSSDLAALAAAPWMSHVEALDVSANPVGADGVEALLGGSAPGVLRTLDLTGCRLEDDAASALASSPVLETVERLSLGGNAFTASGVRTILEAAWFDPARVELPRE